MTAEQLAKAAEIDKQLAAKRWAAYPLLVQALKDAMWAFTIPLGDAKGGEAMHAIDRAAQLLILLGEQKQQVPSCCQGGPTKP